ncbi:hypothetical protein [Coleofasciculus sp. H7-2]|uniref:hypothetical protein n=1 Tax=Coleofasciculus sp. H7-2 TaxID=3351545 RepID=UPI003670B05A
MSIPKKGTRRIIVDREMLLWLIRRKATNTQSDYGCGYLHVAVEHAQEPGSVLVILTDKPHPQDWRTTEVRPVKPSDITGWILQAKQIGWQPKKSGVPFVVKVAGECLKKYKFL